MHKNFMFCNTCIDKKWNLPQSMCTYTRNDIILIIFLFSSNSDPLQRVTGGHLEPVLAGNEWELGYSGRVFTLLKELAYTDRQQNITQGRCKPAINLTHTSLDSFKPGVLKDFHANPTYRPWPTWESNPLFFSTAPICALFYIILIYATDSRTEWLQVWTF